MLSPRPFLWLSLSFTLSASTPTALPVPGHGGLRLELPAQWKETARSTPKGLPPTITFERQGTPRGSLEITVLWTPKPDPTFAQEANIRALTLKGQAQVRDKALEKVLPLLTLQGAQGKGFYYVATDRAYKATVPPTAGEYPVLTHGEVGVEVCVVSFSLFSDEKDSTATQEGLAAVRGARLIPIASH